MKPFHIALTTALLVFASSAGAGTFRLTSANTWIFQSQQVDHTGAGALAEAKYDGTLDSNDNSWSIVAHLHSSFGGPYGGDANSGAGITEGMIIKCGQGCGGQADLPNCANGTVVSYYSKATVAIYHQFSPEIDEMDGTASHTTCTVTASPDGGGSCLYSEPDQDGCCEGTCTPIILDLGGGGFELSGTEPPVLFDIDADGALDAISWTRLGGDEAFLALDRNGNGVIDSGSELFGAATEQPPSDDPNGFLALAVFDTPAAGGNGDGRITADDAVFSRLVLWNDVDRDGRSSPSELTSLGDHGIVELSIEHVISERRDRYGNRFRWTGHARTAEVRPITASDVVFVSAPDQSPPR